MRGYNLLKKSKTTTCDENIPKTMEKAPSLVLFFMLAMINIMNLLDGRHYVDNNLHKL
jgi:hypothetical protein